MRFLVTSTNQHPVPPEAVTGLIDALIVWVNKYTESGQIETVWANAGREGGGGILNVDSPEELDAIMAEFPFGPFSEVKVQALVELIGSLQHVKQVAEARLQAMG